MSFTVCSTVRPTMTSPKSISGSLNRTYGYLPTAVTEQLYDSVGSAWPDWSVRAQIALTTYPEASAREHERRLALQSELVLAEKLEARGAPAASGPRASRVARARVGIVGARRRRVARRGGDPPAPPA